MRRIILISVFMFSCFSIFGSNIYAEAYTNNHYRTNIIAKDITDGDTFKITYHKRPERIRVLGIDTPERGKKYYKEAKDFLGSMIINKPVNIYITNIGTGNRPVAMVTAGQGINNKKLNVNEELIKAGLAIVSRDYCEEPYYGEWMKLQEEAKKNKVGFWADESYYPEIEAMIKKNRKQTEKKEQPKLKAIKK